MLQSCSLAMPIGNLSSARRGAGTLPSVLPADRALALTAAPCLHSHSHGRATQTLSTVASATVDHSFSDLVIPDL